MSFISPVLTWDQKAERGGSLYMSKMVETDGLYRLQCGMLLQQIRNLG